PCPPRRPVLHAALSSTPPCPPRRPVLHAALSSTPPCPPRRPVLHAAMPAMPGSVSDPQQQWLLPRACYNAGPAIGATGGGNARNIKAERVGSGARRHG